MKRKINMLFLLCLCLSFSACSKPISFTLDESFTSVFSGSDDPLLSSNALALNEDDHQDLSMRLSSSTWIKVNSSMHESSAFIHLIGTSKAIYSFYQEDLTTFIDVDSDKDGDPEFFYSSSDIKWLELKLWIEDLRLSTDRLNELKTKASFSNAFIGSVQAIDQLRQVTLSSENKLELKGFLDFDQWVHIPEIPSLDPIDDVLYVLESTMDGSSMMLSFYLKNDLVYVVISSAGSLDSYFQVEASISASLLAFLESLWDAILPVDDVPSIVFSQAYIGPTQYIYDYDTLLSDYLFSLTPTQNLDLRTLFDLGSWTEVSEPSYYQDAEFVLISTTGVILYLSGNESSYSIRVNDHDIMTYYVSESSNFQTINETINSYFIPQAPPQALIDTRYTIAQYYEGPIQDMMSPDLSVDLTSAQSKTIKDFLDPSSWRQAYDIPPRGVIVMFSLTDENGVDYTVFSFGPTTTLISVSMNDTDRPRWWIGSLSGADSARAFILNIAP
jgi:hypothetical protein